MENNFKPMEIGLPDVQNEKKIRDFYTQICCDASALVYELEDCLGVVDIELQVLFDFLKSEDPENFLYERYVECKNPSFPGLSLKKIVELRLIDMPEPTETLIELRKKFQDLLLKTETTSFYFPLVKLWAEEKRVFELNNIFKTQLYHFVRNFTKTERENEILRAINKTIGSLNNLVKIGIIKNDFQRQITDIEDLLSAIVFTPNKEKPFSVHPKIFKYSRMKRHFEKRKFELKGSKPEDILSAKFSDETIPSELTE